VVGVCGRYATTRSAADLSSLFEAVDTTAGALAVDYNVAPTDPVPLIRNSERAGGRVLAIARWGLLPPWAADRRSGARMINARAETVATARAYARPFAVHRCLIPATGWYEFAAPAGPRLRKQAYFMTPYRDEPVVFGGLWSVWSPPDDPGTSVLTCSIVTTGARGPLRAVHDRMPLILSPDRWAAWLGPGQDADALLAAPTDAYIEALEIRPVSPAVGDVRNDGPDLVAPIRAQQPLVEPTLF
jgi:putative SOS response-associated peptidase YedK